MKRIIALLAVSIATLQTSHAQKFDWNVDFAYLFDNYEYDRSSNAFERSYTINAARLTPEFGVRIADGHDKVHRIMAGVDIIKDMGAGIENSGLFHEILLNYRIDARLGRDRWFSATAGCFPRSFAEGDYGGPFFRAEYLFCDPNIEGMFFKYRSPKVRAEIGLDWLGKYVGDSDPARRERFQVLSSGSWEFVNRLSLCWTGLFYHYACSPMAPNVVDNHMLNPYLRWNPRVRSLDVLSVTAGALLSYQNDRDADDLRLPAGFLSRQKVGKWHVNVDNMFYIGEDMQPFRDTYGNELYPGVGAFHLDSPSWTDRLAISYTPVITGWMDLCVAAVFDFGAPFEGIPVYRGCRQVCSLHVNLESLHPAFAAPKPQPQRKKQQNPFSIFDKFREFYEL